MRLFKLGHNKYDQERVNYNLTVWWSFKLGERRVLDTKYSFGQKE